MHLKSAFANNTFAPTKYIGRVGAQKVTGYTMTFRSCTTKNEVQDTTKWNATNVSPDSQDEQELKEITANPKFHQMYKLLQLEIDVLRSNGFTVPSKLTPAHWVQLLKCRTKNQKGRLLHFFWLNERHRVKEARRKGMKKLKESERLEDLNDDVGSTLHYGLGYNTIFMRIYDKNMNKVYHKRIFNAQMYGISVIFDFGYSEFMNNKEASNSAKQIALAYANNKINSSPLYWYFCNVDPMNRLMQIVKKRIPIITNDDFPITITSDPPTSICDKSKLVYLTPDSPNVLNKFDPNDMYVIGAYVDKNNHKPYSLSAARRYGVRHAKFPLHLLNWANTSTKILTVNQVHDILLDISNTGDWTEALKHVPHRKLKTAEERREYYKAAKHNSDILKNMRSLKRDVYNNNLSENPNGIV